MCARAVRNNSFSGKNLDASAINHLTRAADWQGATEPIDVLVIGAGVTGCGVALDAASRGFKTLLVDSSDLAGATSAASSKMLHGGLRYLASGQIGIAYESAVERDIVMQHIAPHLAHAGQWVVPKDHTQSHFMTAFSAVGVFTGDLLRILAGTPAHVMAPPSIIGARRTLELAPALRPDTVHWAVNYHDALLVDDARLVVDLARTARAFGAEVLTRTTASVLGEHRVILRDELSGQSLEVNPKVVINAAGVWAGKIDPRVSLMPSRGSHVVVKAATLGNPQAIFTTAVPGTFGRFVFAVPASDSLVYIGLTDTPDPQLDGHMPDAPQEDIDFILSTINRCLATPLTHADVVGTFSGLRPLIYDPKSEDTSEVSRRHLLLDHDGGPITIAGGKLTTYRAMAQDAVDSAARRLGREVACRTKEIGLVGAASANVLSKINANQYRVSHYGTSALELTALAKRFPELDVPAAPDSQVTGIELLYGAIAEGALSEEDLLARRTRLWLDESRRAAAMPLATRALEEAAQVLSDLKQPA